MITRLGLKCWRWPALLLTAALLAACGGASTGKVTADWMTDPVEAMQSAQQRNRPLFIAFVGMDWSVASQGITDEIFNTQAFKDYADEHLVLLRVDLARKPPSDKAAQQNNALAEQLQVGELPVCYLYDAARHNIIGGRMNGYVPGGPNPYLQSMADRLVQWQQMLAQQPPAGSPGAMLGAPQLSASQISSPGMGAPPAMAAPLPPALSVGPSTSVSPTPEQLMQQIQQQSAAPAPLPAPAAATGTDQPLPTFNALK
jgi:thioredoxin-related protein